MKKYIMLIIIFMTQNSLARSISYEDEFVNSFLAALFIGIVFYIMVFLIQQLYIQAIRGTKYVKKEIVEAKYKEHKNKQERYRKYLKDCDKQGKVPLSYKQWKFAYAKKTVKTHKKTKLIIKKEKTTKKMAPKNTYYYDDDDE